MPVPHFFRARLLQIGIAITRSSAMLLRRVLLGHHIGGVIRGETASIFWPVMLNHRSWGGGGIRGSRTHEVTEEHSQIEAPPHSGAGFFLISAGGAIRHPEPRLADQCVGHESHALTRAAQCALGPCPEMVVCTSSVTA